MISISSDFSIFKNADATIFFSFILGSFSFFLFTFIISKNPGDCLLFQ
jgi:hypothetical protein